MLLSTTTYPTTGSAGDAFWTLLNNVLLLHESNDQFIQSELEIFIRAAFGDGILKGSYTPPLLSIGTGLNVDIAPHTTVNGFANVIANPYAQPIPPSVTKYLWELQNNTDLSPSYVLSDTIPIYPLPGTVDNLPTLLGQITTDATNVTAITPLFNIVGDPVTSVTGTAPVTVVTTGPAAVVSMHVADASHDGYLAQGDWSSFAGKESAGIDLRLAGGTMAGDINMNGHNIIGVENIVDIGHITDSSGDIANMITITAGNTSQAFLFSTLRISTPHIVVTPNINPLTNYWISGISTAGFTVNIAALQAFDIPFSFICLE